MRGGRRATVSATDIEMDNGSIRRFWSVTSPKWQMIWTWILITGAIFGLMKWFGSAGFKERIEDSVRYGGTVYEATERQILVHELVREEKFNLRFEELTRQMSANTETLKGNTAMLRTVYEHLLEHPPPASMTATGGGGHDE